MHPINSFNYWADISYAIFLSRKKALNHLLDSLSVVFGEELAQKSQKPRLLFESLKSNFCDDELLNVLLKKQHNLRSTNNNQNSEYWYKTLDPKERVLLKIVFNYQQSPSVFPVLGDLTNLLAKTEGMEKFLSHDPDHPLFNKKCVFGPQILSQHLAQYPDQSFFFHITNCPSCKKQAKEIKRKIEEINGSIPVFKVSKDEEDNFYEALSMPFWPLWKKYQKNISQFIFKT